MERYFDVFVRNWWRREGGRLVPEPAAPRFYLARHVTESVARRICAEYQVADDMGIIRNAECAEV